MCMDRQRLESWEVVIMCKCQNWPWLILYAEGSFLNSTDNGYRCSCPSSSVKRERRMEIGEELRLEDQERRS